MAFLHKISGYLVDINEEYFEEDIVTELEERLELRWYRLTVKRLRLIHTIDVLMEK